jgi:aminoglycoside phosphotransferase
MRAPSDVELREGFERALAAVGLELEGEIGRRPSPYRTSFPIEELSVSVSGLGPLRVAFKRLDWEGLEPMAKLAKPRFLHDPNREPSVYRALPASTPVGPPRYLGSLLEGDRHWLFVEWVEGRELFQVGERELWEQAARWLAGFHAALAPEWRRHAQEGRLIEHDSRFYRGWMRRARDFARKRGQDSTARAVEWLAPRHEPVVEALLSLPRTVTHGEFYASNVLVADTGGEARVAAVDWELAAVAPGHSDLAALVSGWSATDCDALVAAYASEPGAPEVKQRDLDFARLQVAIQWLGWAPPEWEPPDGQRHDWAKEAVELAERLEL